MQRQWSQRRPTRPGGRGYAGSSRAARYGLASMTEHRAASAARTVVIAQIEDVEALDELDAIASTPGLDALFVGRIDLTVALDAASPDAPEVIAAVDRVIAAGGGGQGYRSACSCRATRMSRGGA